MKTLVLTATVLSALALAVPAAATPIICLGSTCPGGILMCIDGDVDNAAECAGVPNLDCPAVYYEFNADVVVVGYGPCTNVDVTVLGQPILP